MPQRFAFILVDDFALLSAASAVDPLRAANQMSGRILYETIFLSAAGGPVRSSCGGYFQTIPIEQAPPEIDWIFVIAGGDRFAKELPVFLGYLRQCARRGIPLGGISGGVVVLAKAGLLQMRRIAVHWEYVHSLRELDSELVIEQRLFVLDRDRATCAGGVAALDMMHGIIRSSHGQLLADQISGRFIYTQIRNPEAAQRGLTNEQAIYRPGVFAALRLMEDHIADPLPMSQLARLAGISSRQLQRQFRDNLGRSVMAHYSAVRLSKAEELLRQTVMPIGQIAYATGYSSQSNFNRAFSSFFHVSPAKARALKV